MLDAITFETRGIPSTAVLTTPFVAVGQLQAETCNMPGYPFVVLPNPVTSLALPKVEDRADQATPYVESLLLTGSTRPLNDVVAISSLIDGNHAISRVLEDLVSELATPLRANGADLTARIAGPGVASFQLRFANESAVDHIPTGVQLVETFSLRIQEALGDEWTAILEDPRAS